MSHYACRIFLKTLRTLLISVLSTTHLEWPIWAVGSLGRSLGMRDHQAGLLHDDVIKWKHFPRYWPFVQGIHRSPVNSPHKSQWRGALMFSFICLNKRLSKQSWGWWFEMLSRPLWRHRDGLGSSVRYLRTTIVWPWFRYKDVTGWTAVYLVMVWGLYGFVFYILHQAACEMTKWKTCHIHSTKKFSNTSAWWITRHKHLLEWSQHLEYCMYTLYIWTN